MLTLILIYTGEIPGSQDVSQLQLTDEIFGPALDEVTQINCIFGIKEICITWQQ